MLILTEFAAISNGSEGLLNGELQSANCKPVPIHKLRE